MEDHSSLRRVLETQAEISFKAGQKEVVEELGKYCYVWHDEENMLHLCIDKPMWQAKLKDWGLE